MNPIDLQSCLREFYPKPKSQVLYGDHCELHPLNKAKHALALYKVFSLDNTHANWQYLPYGPFYSETEFIAWIDKFCTQADPLFYVVYIGNSLEPVGVTSLLNIKPNHGSIEIGHVHFSPRLRQTAASTEAHYLLMQYIFEQLGYRRLEWKCDEANDRSKQCARRLGFTFEGIFRQHMIVKSANRDTAWFSMLDKEWPDIKARLEHWLNPNNFTRDGQQL
ncbi:MAG: GNAT family protein, partial [Pseudomonadota bacterium]